MGMDTTHTYCFEWQGYSPNDFSNMVVNDPAGVVLQLHGHDGLSPVAALTALYGKDGTWGTPGLKALYLEETDENDHDSYHYVCDLADLVNQTHTFKLIFKEGKGYTGQTAFIELKRDGVVKYYRNIGDVGRSWINISGDYPKFTTIYDYGSAFVDASNHTKNRKFAMVSNPLNPNYALEN